MGLLAAVFVEALVVWSGIMHVAGDDDFGGQAQGVVNHLIVHTSFARLSILIFILPE